MSARQSIYIEAPVGQVFDWFKNPGNWPALNPDVARREEITDLHVSPEGVGTFHVWSLRPLPGLRFECFGVFTEFVPDRRIVDRWSLAMEGDETYLFDGEGSGTRVTIERRRRSFWRLPPLGLVLDLVEGRQTDDVLARLKNLMESSAETMRAAG